MKHFIEGKNKMETKNLYSKSTATMKTSMIREMLAQTKGVADMISFAGGFPSPMTFPTVVLSELFREVTLDSGSDILQYGASEGDAELKEALLSYESDTNPKTKLTHDELLICNGATNGIYYFTRAFIDIGDVILCEGPTFLGSVVSFEAAGAEVVSVEMDENGICIDKLTETISKLKSQHKKIKFFYTIPDFQNPTGITMSLQRRHELINICQSEKILILEDDPYSELRYSGEPIPTIFNIARNEYNDTKLVTIVKSFSKILGPGLRIAVAIGHEEIISNMGSWLQKIIVSVDGVTQRTIARYIKRGYLKPHIESIRSFYKPFQAAIITALETHMPKTVQFTKPEGGIFIWLKSSKDINFDQIFAEVVKQKVCYIPGSKFYPQGYEKHNALRLNFSYPSIEQIHTGVEILGKVIKSKE
jgi:2-aminoadipate transaminase